MFESNVFWKVLESYKHSIATTIKCTCILLHFSITVFCSTRKSSQVTNAKELQKEIGSCLQTMKELVVNNAIQARM